MSLNPSVIAEEAAYLVVYKPPNLHTAPLKRGGAEGGAPAGTLLDWCARRYPELLTVQGRQPWEGGLLHRLDRETAGLVLAARTQDAFASLAAQQEAGLVIKEYEAAAAALPALELPPGFPPPPGNGGIPSIIESAFRPYGLGRKAVRPVLDRRGLYQTEIIGSAIEGEGRRFFLRLRRGFRHQIRSHLAWIGYPLLNDALYGGPQAALPGGGIALKACGLLFSDPGTGALRCFRA
ncbi:MAG: RNA pseudouridine synthase [Treponema sp.]|jgi:23S rRNA pseudouridine1911/1915/1917 synthase|nr:RNA pseudouridine synthase [Treponema sp.]